MINLIQIYLFVDVMIFFGISVQYPAFVKYMCILGNVNTALKQELRLSGLSALKTANISLSIHKCVWDLVRAPAPAPWVTAEPQWMCVLHAAAADRRVALAEQVGAAAMRSSTQTHDTGRWPEQEGAVWRGGQAAGVYVNVYGICLYACP